MGRVEVSRNSGGTPTSVRVNHQETSQRQSGCQLTPPCGVARSGKLHDPPLAIELNRRVLRQRRRRLGLLFSFRRVGARGYSDNISDMGATLICPGSGNWRRVVRWLWNGVWEIVGGDGDGEW